MLVFLLVMFCCIALAVGVGALVMVGMQGYFKDRSPDLARMLAKTAQHLNGDAPSVGKLDNLLEDVGSR